MAAAAPRVRGPAAAAGLKPGDIIVEFDGKPVTDFASLVSLIDKTKPGDRIEFKVERDQRTIDLVLVMKRRGDR